MNFSQDLVRNLLAKAEKARLPLSIKTPLVFSLHHDLQVSQLFLKLYRMFLDSAKIPDQRLGFVGFCYFIHSVLIWPTFNGFVRVVQLCFCVGWSSRLLFLFGYSTECCHIECHFVGQRFHYSNYDSFLLYVC